MAILYFCRRHARSRHAGILVLAMIAVLQQAISPSVRCMANLAHQDPTTVESSNHGLDETENDSCCFYCFCCHFAGVLNSAAPGFALVTNRFPAPRGNQLPLHLSISPFDRPPRV